MSPSAETYAAPPGAERLAALLQAVAIGERQALRGLYD
ncbi:RNA polymerase subunit sigma-24, partial [Pseudomonas sp. GW460-13]